MYFKIEYIKHGKVEEIIISAPNVQEAIKKFRKKKLGILKEIYEIQKASFFEELIDKLDLAKIDLEEFVSVLDQMYVMLDAGIGIDVVFSNVIKGIKNKKLKKIFTSIQNDIQAGFSLTTAFEKFEKDLGNLTVSMIKLGEETGDLARAVKDLSHILTEILENRKRLKKATRYPLFIIFAMSIAFVIVILFVIPPFKSIFAQMHAELPLPTRFLLWIEYALEKYGIYVLLGAIGIMGIITYLYNTNKKVKFLLDKLILKVYIVGPVIKLAMIGRFVYVLQRLVDAGIPIMYSVDIALNIVDNSYIRSNLEKIKQNIIAGGSIYKGFEESKMFEEMTIQMIKAGEESGAIVKMLEKVSKYYLDKYRYIVDNIAVMIEPILIAAIAGFVMTLALGIFLPMWNLTQAVK
jgi:general secretion pathway protein F